ncbi:MAG: hypothetical protein LBE21_09830 [Pseudomonadales bacterium]|jgi:hypothetical protein|nr:hypothetical protein [Pseudomonadales bacterium]
MRPRSKLRLATAAIITMAAVLALSACTARRYDWKLEPPPARFVEAG